MMDVSFYCKKNETILRQENVCILGKGKLKYNGRDRLVWKMDIMDGDTARFVALPISEFELLRVRVMGL